MEEVLMGYEIKYDTTDRSKAEAKALADIKGFWGARRYNKFVKAFSIFKGRVSFIELEIALAMNGVEGYPAQVFIDKYYSPQMELELQ
jgi:hypothetical protein